MAKNFCINGITIKQELRYPKKVIHQMIQKKKLMLKEESKLKLPEYYVKKQKTFISLDSYILPTAD